MNVRSKSLTILSIGLSIGLMGCSLSPVGPNAKLSLEIWTPPRIGPNLDSTNGFSFDSAPATVDGFNCLAVNVMATDIPVNVKDYQPPTSNLALNGGVCSYPGIYSGTAAVSPAGGPVNLSVDVPRGAARLVQVMGVVGQTSGKCDINPNLGNGQTDAYLAYPEVYEIGRTTINTLEDVSVTIKTNYVSASASDVRCSAGGSGYGFTSCTDALAQAATPLGQGTTVDPYHICTTGQFKWINDAQKCGASAHIALEKSITADPTSVPVALCSAGFAGTFDGTGKSITGLTHAAFASVGSSGIVKNLILSTSPLVCTGGALGTVANSNAGLISGVQVNATTISCSTDTDIGSVVGTNTGTLSGVSVTSSSITGYDNVGGIVGRNVAGTVSDNSSVTSTSVAGRS